MLSYNNYASARAHGSGEYCVYYASQHLGLIAKWAQANGKVERQNASIKKRIHIAQAAELDWKKELRKYE